MKNHKTKQGGDTSLTAIGVLPDGRRTAVFTRPKTHQKRMRTTKGIERPVR